MDKYQKILKLFQDLIKELRGLNEIEFEKLILGTEFSILFEKEKQLEMEARK